MAQSCVCSSSALKPPRNDKFKLFHRTREAKTVSSSPVSSGRKACISMPATPFLCPTLSRLKPYGNRVRCLGPFGRHCSSLLGATAMKGIMALCCSIGGHCRGLVSLVAVVFAARFRFNSLVGSDQGYSAAALFAQRWYESSTHACSAYLHRTPQMSNTHGYYAKRLSMNQGTVVQLRNSVRDNAEA